MKRQWIVIVAVVVSLVSSTAYAGEAGKESSSQWCSTVSEWRNVPYSVAEWQILPDAQKLKACQKAQPFQVVKGGSGGGNRGLVIAGLITTFAGVAMVLPPGETYSILGDAFCVGDYSIDYGACHSAAPLIGLAALGGGITMMAVGMHGVHVSPMIGHGVKGVSAKIKWGGSHAKR